MNQTSSHQSEGGESNIHTITEVELYSVDSGEIPESCDVQCFLATVNPDCVYSRTVAHVFTGKRKNGHSCTLISRERMVINMLSDCLMFATPNSTITVTSATLTLSL